MKQWLVVAALAASGCGVSIQDFQATARAARACRPGISTCRNAGAAACLCPTPVESAQVKTIDDQAASVSCGGISVACHEVINLRCGDDGLCTGDPSP